KVSGNGLVIEIFHDTSLPETLPSKISAEPWSPLDLPVSLSPEDCRLTEILRSPIGVFSTTFQLPSADISFSQVVGCERGFDANGSIGRPRGCRRILPRRLMQKPSRHPII